MVKVSQNSAKDESLIEFTHLIRKQSNMEKQAGNYGFPVGLDGDKLSKEEAKVFSNIQSLLDDYFTGNICLHISEGSIRKVETTAVERVHV